MTIALHSNVAGEETRYDDNSVDSLRSEIFDRVKVHTEMIARLLAEPTLLPQDFPAFLEDIANAYLDIAEEVAATSNLNSARPN